MRLQIIKSDCIILCVCLFVYLGLAPHGGPCLATPRAEQFKKCKQNADIAVFASFHKIVKKYRRGERPDQLLPYDFKRVKHMLPCAETCR